MTTAAGRVGGDDAARDRTGLGADTGVEGPGQVWPRLPVRGTEVHYYVLCPRKCWFFMRGLEQERYSDLVAVGKVTDETTFQRATRRGVELQVEGESAAKLDFTQEGLVHEVKHGRSQRQAHRMQLAYYLWVLKRRGVQTKGILHYPRQRRREVVELTEDLERKVVAVLRRIRELRTQERPPPVPGRMGICRGCAYELLCWTDDDVSAEGEGP